MASATAGESDAHVVAGYKRGHQRGISLGCVRDVVHTHALDGLNYMWLWAKYGRLAWLDFEEPSGSNNWKTYGRYWFTRHGAEVSHHPDELVEDHVRTFVDPETRTIALRFYFVAPRDGSVYVTAPTREFYELEADFFRRHGFCSQTRVPAADEIIARFETEHHEMKGLAPFWPPHWVDRPVLETPPPATVPNIDRKRPSATVQRRLAKTQRSAQPRRRSRA